MDKSSKTAINRKGPSAPLTYYLVHNDVPTSAKILDFGCGKGEDVKYLKFLKYKNVVGWDKNFWQINGVAEPNSMHGDVSQPAPERDCYDIVFLTYVLNTIEHPVDRYNLLRKVVELYDPGELVVTVRSYKELFTAYSSMPNAKLYNDGFVTTKNTFQAFFTEEYLKGFFKRLQPAVPDRKLKFYSPGNKFLMAVATL